MSSTKKHFDDIANQYDYFKKRNRFYYKNLREFYKIKIPPNRKVIEIGCGTGDIIAEIKANKKVGVDISHEMINIARQKHPDVQFEVGNVENLETEEKFDYIFLADVIEHIENLPMAMKTLERICSQETKIIFTYANPLWEPLLLALEKMNLKMPEGPHYRIPYFRFKKLFRKYGFKKIERGWRLLIPTNIPFFSNLVNSIFYHIPLIKRFGMLEYLIIQKK